MSKFSNFYQDVKQGNLLSVTIGLLNDCPSRCIYCRKYTYPKEELDIGYLFNAILYLKKQGLQSIVFSGGEPLQYKHLIQVLQFCNSLDIQTSMITTLIPTKQLREAAELCTRIHVSVDGASPETYKVLRGVDALETVKQHLSEVNAIRKNKNLLPVRISVVISNKNYKEIVELYKLALNTNSTINFYFVHTHSEFYLTNEQYDECLTALHTCNEYDERWHLSNAKEILTEQMTPIASCKSKDCKLPYITCEIAPDGKIYPCCNLYDENAEYNTTSNNSYGTIYTNDLETEFKKRFNITYGLGEYCKSCVPSLSRYIDEVNEIINDKSTLKLFI